MVEQTSDDPIEPARLLVVFDWPQELKRLAANQPEGVPRLVDTPERRSFI